MPQPPSSDATDVEHFTQCALRGRHRSGSTGERTCRALATQLASIGDDIALLDTSALNGYFILCQLASGPWQTDDEKHNAFALIKRAAS